MESTTELIQGAEARILIVEDDPILLPLLETHYRRLFEAQGYETVTVETAKSADEAKERARKATRKPYDFVSLDVNLGKTSVEMGRVLTGLDVLRVLKAYNSAWMVVLLTGVDTDASLDATVGKADAEVIRRKLRRDAYQNFFPERLQVVEKPRNSDLGTGVPTAEEGLLNRLNQIVDVFRVVSQQRYVFRTVIVDSVVRVPVPQKEGKAKSKLMPVKVTRWQIRYNCGEQLTIEGCKGFEIVHHLLGLDQAADPVEPSFLNALVGADTHLEPDEEQSELEQALAAYFKLLGVTWTNLSKEQKAAQLSLLAPNLKRLKELKELEADDDISLDEQDDLARITKELGPLAEPLEDFLTGRAESPFVEALASGFDVATAKDAAYGGAMQRDAGNYTKQAGAKGFDSPEAVKARKYLERVRDHLRKNGFPALADHLQIQIMSAGAKWSYIAPPGVEWAV